MNLDGEEEIRIVLKKIEHQGDRRNLIVFAAEWLVSEQLPPPDDLLMLQPSGGRASWYPFATFEVYLSGFLGSNLPSDYRAVIDTALREVQRRLPLVQATIDRQLGEPLSSEDPVTGK